MSVYCKREYCFYPDKKCESSRAGCIVDALELGNSPECWYVRIDFGQAVPDVVVFMKSIYGGSLKHYDHNRKKHPNWKPRYQYRLSSSPAVLQFLKDIYPYVREKRSQVEAILHRWKSKMPVEEGMKLKSDLSAMKKGTYEKDR